MIFITDASQLDLAQSWVYKLLTVPQRQRVRKIHHVDDAQLYIATHLVQLYIASQSGPLQDAIAYTSTGRPYLRNQPHWDFNLTNHGGLVASVLEKQPGARVGIDLADCEEPVVDSFLESDQIFTADEIDTIKSAPNQSTVLYTLWGLKEAYFKYTGEGIARVKMSSIEFRLNSQCDQVCSIALNGEPLHLETYITRVSNLVLAVVGTGISDRSVTTLSLDTIKQALKL